jgi:predicted NAD-dependent protein-ADP-ribosyltransferase YbiA (DUF1768 family)
MPITFTKVRLPHGWLGNMSPHPLRYLGATWRTAEALFQALRFDDPSVREEIRGKASPMATKFVARRHAARMTVEPGGPADLANLEVCLRLKLDQHPELRDRLLATGDEHIAEDVTRRSRSGRHLVWGMALRDGVWVGENRLGGLWMRLRDELRSPAACSPTVR